MQIYPLDSTYTIFIVSYLFYLFACMCSCDTLDGVSFEDHQGQGFEEYEQQQQFQEGKWTLDHIC